MSISDRPGHGWVASTARLGVPNLIEPGPAWELGNRKVQNCLSTGAEMIVSANPGCLIQISTGLERAGRTIPVLHMVELLDASVHGTSREALLRNIHR